MVIRIGITWGEVKTKEIDDKKRRNPNIYLGHSSNYS